MSRVALNTKAITVAVAELIDEGATTITVGQVAERLGGVLRDSDGHIRRDDHHALWNTIDICPGLKRNFVDGRFYLWEVVA